MNPTDIIHQPDESPIPLGDATKGAPASAGPEPTPTTRGFHSRPALIRLATIARLLRQGRAINCRSLAAYLGCCRKTIVRDIALLRDPLGYLIEWDALDGSYRLRRAPEPIL